MTHGSVAAKVRAHKEAHPELYCEVRGCLWRVLVDGKSSPCRKHPHAYSSIMAESPTTRSEREPEYDDVTGSDDV